MWKSNVKNIFHIPCWPAGVSTGQNTKLHRKVNTSGVCQNTRYAGSWLTAHASTQPAVGAAKHHNQNAYLTAMFGHYIRGYFNNLIRLQSQTEFTAKHRKQHGILWLDTSLSRMRKLAHWSWPTFEATYAGSLPYYSTTFRCMIGKGPGKQS